MKTVILTKDELNADLFQDVKFFSVAEGGAMGMAGEIIFLNRNGKSFTRRKLRQSRKTAI